MLKASHRITVHRAIAYRAVIAKIRHGIAITLPLVTTHVIPLNISIGLDNRCPVVLGFHIPRVHGALLFVLIAVIALRLCL